MQWLEKLLPNIDPVLIKMGLEFLMNFFNYIAARFFVFEDRKEKTVHEA